MSELVALGAPNLPEGMFYRISFGAYGQVYVDIREDRKRFGSRSLEKHFFYPDDMNMTLGHMCEKCFELYQKNHAEVIKRRAAYDEIKKYLGDHR